MKCRICKSGSLKEIFKNNSCPKTSHKFLTKQELATDKMSSVRVLKCNICGMVQLADAYSEEEYVSDYQRNISFSKSALLHMSTMASDLAGFGVKNIVEVGCGNGTFASLLKDSSGGKIKTTAFEPSKAAYKAAVKRGVKVYNRFFDKTLPKNISNFDGFSMRFVLEHLDDPNGILNEIKKRCKPGAVGLIEVPNAQKQFADNRWFDYFPEHILYFTPYTLAYALNNLGFEILSLKTTMKEEFLAILVRVPEDKIFKNHEQMKKQFWSMVKGSTYLWGASGGATTFISSIFGSKTYPKNIRYLVDSDVNKWGLFASGSKVEIVSPKEVQNNPPDTVIIMAVSYEKEIREQLKSMGYKGRVRSMAECLPEVK
jgi:SAM-dependent methyltransferase